MPFERYADDAVVHCVSERQARGEAAIGGQDGTGRAATASRQDQDRLLQGRTAAGWLRHTSFTFFGFTFRARAARGKAG